MTAFNEYFIEKGIDYSAYFYNPNIHPYKEYLKRRNVLEMYAAKIGINLIVDESFMQHYWENNFKGALSEERCARCYRVLSAGAALAGAYCR